jgi:hypothetical protein
LHHHQVRSCGVAAVVVFTIAARRRVTQPYIATAVPRLGWNADGTQKTG